MDDKQKVFLNLFVSCILLAIEFKGEGMFGSKTRMVIRGTGDGTLDIKDEWPVSQWSGKNGATSIAVLYDVDGDGEKEIVCNVGSQAAFYAFKPDGTIVWKNIIHAGQHKHAYYPRYYDGNFYYGDRLAGKVYSIRLSDGFKVWEASTPGIQCINYCDQGVVVGYTNAVDILQFSDGVSVGGNWPVNPGFTPHEQVLAVGDLDGDGNDEVFCNNTSGTIKGIDNDGTIMFTITTGNVHVDVAWIFDLYNNGTNYLIATVDDDDSSSGNEGDEIAVYNSSGTQVDKATIGDGVAFNVGYFDEGRVVYGIEDKAKTGMLDENLDALWSKDDADEVGTTSTRSNIDLDGDGINEIITNTGEDSSSGFMILDSLTGRLMAEVEGYGWAPIISGWKYGSWDSYNVIDFDMDGDGSNEMITTNLGANNTTDPCTLYLVGYRQP